jgi:phosphate-selective porin
MDKGAVAGGPVTAGWDKGFYVKSTDDKFRLNLGGYIQTRFTYADLEDAQDTSSFSVRRARLIFDGHIYDKSIQYKVQVEAAGGEMTLRDAYINVAPMKEYEKEAQIRAGQFKSPMGRQFLTSSRNLSLQERSLASNTFVPDRQVGAMFHGECWDGHLEYATGIFNGDGQNVNVNDNNAVMSVSRIVFNFLGADNKRFEYDETDPLAYGVKDDEERNSPLRGFLGGSYMYNPDRAIIAGATEDLDTNQVGAEAGLRVEGFTLYGEYFVRHISSSADGFDNLDEPGWFAHAGYLFTNHIEIAGRYSETQLDTPGVGRQNEVVLGLNYYFYGHRLKLQTEYVYQRQDLSGDELHQNIIRAQLQLAF